MFPPSRITLGPAFGGQGLSSSLSSSSQLSPHRMHRLWRTVQAIAFLIAKSIVLSKRFCNILHRLFSKPNAHSTFTLADESSLLNLISLRSLVPSGYGFINHGLRGYALSPTRYGPISRPFMLKLARRGYPLSLCSSKNCATP